MIRLRLTAAALLAGAGAAALAGCSSAASGAARSSAPSLPSFSIPTGAPAPASQPPKSSAAPAALPDPCALLSRAEAEKLIGLTLEPGDDTPARNPDTDTATCTYTAPVTGESGQVAVFVQKDMPHALEVDRAIGHKFRTIPGIGDQALEEDGSIFVRHGAVWIYVNAAITTPPSHLEAAARLMVTRLP